MRTLTFLSFDIYNMHKNPYLKVKESVMGLLLKIDSQHYGQL